MLSTYHFSSVIVQKRNSCKSIYRMNIDFNCGFIKIFFLVTVGPKMERFPYESRYEDGKLFYENEWYSKGHHIIIDNREDSPVQ